MRTPALAASLALAVLGCGGGAYQADVTATTTSPGYPQYVEAAYIDPEVQVIVDSDVPMFYSDNYYWRYYGNTWYRSPYADTGWVAIEYYSLPEPVRRIQRPERYVHYRVDASKRVRIPTRHHDQTVRRDQPTRPDIRRDVRQPIQRPADQNPPTPIREPDRYYPPKAPDPVPDRTDRPDRPYVPDRPDIRDNRPDNRGNRDVRDKGPDVRPDDRGRDVRDNRPDDNRGRGPVEKDRPDVKDKPNVRPSPNPTPPDVRTPGRDRPNPPPHEDRDPGPPIDRGDVRDRDKDKDNDRARGNSNDDRGRGRERDKDKDKDEKDKDKNRHPDR
jgi:hypothetical protein